MGTNFDTLDHEGRTAVEWKARQNLAMALGSGNSAALANQDKFIDNNREGLASNKEGLKHVIFEYKQNLADILDD